MAYVYEEARKGLRSLYANSLTLTWVNLNQMTGSSEVVSFTLKRG